MGILDSISPYLTSDKFAAIVRVSFLIIIAIPILFIISKWVRKTITKSMTPQRGLIASKTFFYIGILFVIFSVLNEFGFKLSHLLGAAGILGIALGFASQTSVSNVISGLFLMTEQPFVIDDIINVGDVTGQVLSIDILSIKIRTFDNKLVRIPNETMLKGQLTNLTHFPLRRVDLEIGVAYKEDIAKVREILLDVAQNNPLSLQEPEPLFIFSGFGNSSIDLKFMVWGIKSDYLKLKNSMLEEIKKRFDEEQIEIPFPHLSMYTGNITQPFPIQIVDKPNGSNIKKLSTTK